MKTTKKLSIILTAVIFLSLLASPVFAFTQEDNMFEVNFEFKGYAEKPVIDGILDEFGYSKLDIKPGDVSYGGNDGTLEEYAKAMQYDIYASYDQDYVYLFVSMENKYYNNDGTGGWDQAGVQVGLSNVGEAAAVCEFMAGRDSSTGDLVITYYTQYDGAEAELELVEGTDFQIIPDGDRMNHEFKIPVNTFYDGGKLKEGAQFTMCIVLDENDNGYIHTQIASGLSNGRNIAQFATVTLGAAIEKAQEPTPEEVPEEVSTEVSAEDSTESPAPAPAPESAPETGDSGTIILVIMAIASGAVIFGKKRFSRIV